MELIASLLISCAETLIKIAPYLIVAGLLFPVLSFFFACNSSRPWWRSPDLATDLAYWLLVPVFTRFLRIGLAVLGAGLIFGIEGEKDLIAFFQHGHGPLAQLPLWVQTAVYLLVSDLLLYWSHRLFHGGAFWKYHAIHHSSKEVDWISAARFHPVNLGLGTVLVDVVLLLAGIAPAVLGFLVPFTVLMSAFVHANLNWTLGPFKYWLASPVFHRWHHTALDRGGSKNFAPTFPIIDVLFGTFHMPEHELPSDYGIDDPVPKSFGGQLIYPFKQ